VTDKDLAAAVALRELLFRHPEIPLLLFPCPELWLLGFPRPLLSRNLYEELGMSEVAGRIADFIVRVIKEESPEGVIVVGVKGSPTCATETTAIGALEMEVQRDIEEFRRLDKLERIELSREISQKFRREAQPGTLTGILWERFEATFMEFDKDNPEGASRYSSLCWESKAFPAEECFPV